MFVNVPNADFSSGFLLSTVATVAVSTTTTEDVFSDELSLFFESRV
jgi:hypothetical protein